MIDNQIQKQTPIFLNLPLEFDVESDKWVMSQVNVNNITLILPVTKDDPDPSTLPRLQRKSRVHFVGGIFVDVQIPMEYLSMAVDHLSSGELADSEEHIQDFMDDYLATYYPTGLKNAEFDEDGLPEWLEDKADFDDGLEEHADGK
jgi:hypothetical protein